MSPSPHSNPFEVLNPMTGEILACYPSEDLCGQLENEDVKHKN